MKKFLGIVFLGLLWCEISFSKETKLTCEYIETYYRNWDNNQFGDTIKDETATKSAYFNIIKGLNNTYGFETNMYLPNLRVVEDEKFISKVDDNNYTFSSGVTASVTLEGGGDIASAGPVTVSA